MGTTAFRVIDAPTAPEDLIPGEDVPSVALRRLETLWIQITGTLCNIQCAHCFISCGPANHDLEMMSRAQIKSYLDEARELGVKEYYFTGGEPFMHRDVVEILGDALVQGPTTVLTNAMLLREAAVERLAQRAKETGHELTFRVSLDGFDAATNDAIRGPGAFAQAFEGIQRLARHGFTPIVTATRTWECCGEKAMLAGFERMLKDAGVREVRLKILPSLRIGREKQRSRDYTPCERVTAKMMEGFDTSNLICSTARIVTTKGVRVCPILVGAEDATLGQTLKASLGPYPLRHRACHTCYTNGAICSNATGAAQQPSCSESGAAKSP